MNFKSIVSILVFCFVFNFNFSQRSIDTRGVSNQLNAQTPDEIGIRTDKQKNADDESPLGYGIVDDNDVLWSTTIYEIIDLDERVNFPLLYPTQLDFVGNERRPMFWWLEQGIKSGEIDTYDIGSDRGNFIRKEGLKDILPLLDTRVILPDGFEKINNNHITIRSELDRQISKYGFNPYDEGLTDDNRNILAADTTHISLFPYFTIEKEIADVQPEFTYEQWLLVEKFKLYEDDQFGDAEPFDVDTDLPPGLDIDILQSISEELVSNSLLIETKDYIPKPFDYGSIKQWLIKGIWYFDKKYSELIYRPIGLAPVRMKGNDDEDSFFDQDDFQTIDYAAEIEKNKVEYSGDGSEDSDGDGIPDNLENDLGTDPFEADTDGDTFNDFDEFVYFGDAFDFETPPDYDIASSSTTDDSSSSADDDSVSQLEPLFWIFYPQARDIFKKGHAFNSRNATQSISFDEIINSRRFNAVIYKEENVYENREIKKYANESAFMRLLESERIKEKIRNFEHDMWSW